MPTLHIHSRSSMGTLGESTYHVTFDINTNPSNTYHNKYDLELRKELFRAYWQGILVDDNLVSTREHSLL
jgi:hypothetical protein